MCGIVAIISKGMPISVPALQAATRQLHHRGPENQNIWISQDRQVGLGHARLSIIDLIHGIQPISNETNQIHSVVNGEFYGFESIQQELIASGHSLKTNSDSEIALHLYEEYGTHCLQRLRGEFAFALWDERNRTLFAARDRFGIKPLYYSFYNDTLYLASEIKALIAAGVPASWDEESYYRISSHFGQHLGDPERTLFKGIYQVPPSHYLLADRNNRVQLYRYWDINTPSADSIEAGSELAYVEQLREQMQEAVRLRMRADVPVGCYLSGGLDSATVLGMAARYTDRPIQAFTLSFDHEEYDERPIAEEMASLAKADFHPIHVTQYDHAAHFSDAVWHSETIINNAGGVSKYLLSKAVRDAGFKVVLTGEGADEIFAGYPHFRQDMLLYNNQGQDPAMVQNLLAQLQASNRVSSGILMSQGNGGKLHSVKRCLGFIPSWMEAFSSISSKAEALLSDAFLAQYKERDFYQEMLDRIDIQGQLAGRDPVNQSMYLYSRYAMTSYNLTVLGDRMEMAHSIEGRLPFLDHHVVELARSIPVNLKIKGLTEKHVLREAAKPFITDTIYRRQKHPFMSPPAMFSPEQPLNVLIQDTLRGTSLTKLPFFDQKKVIALLDHLPKMDPLAIRAYDVILTSILSACLLNERLIN